MTAIALVLYQLLLGVATLLALPVLLCVRRDELRERLGGGPAAHGRSIWIHAASLGEFEAAWPLVRAWAGGESPIVVSCTNRVARARIAERLPAGVRARLAPVDLLPFIARAMRRERPSCLVFVETEIWPAWLACARARGVPVAFVSARISDRALPRYRRLRFLMKPLMRSVAVVGCRTEEDRRRWIAIGAAPETCHVWGNTKYALGEPIPPVAAGDADGPFVLVGGSVRPGEEGLLDVLSAFAPGQLRLVVVPRHMRELTRWEAACVRQGIAFRRFGHAGIDPRGAADILCRALRRGLDELPPVLLADRIGILRALYASSDAAFVGGTWIPLGGHNLFEPAREGIPVYFGPSISGVRDAAEAIVEAGGGGCVDGPGPLARQIRSLVDNPEERTRVGSGARRAAESLAGAVGRTMEGLRAAGFPAGGRG